ncbi:penicillin acylase family protein [Persicitalea jodogahamensis]|uniref:Penicillin amidase n=1 Tax=Persicitalea jodogahamensis TaxID=402147 RepID=A0A8J3D2C5_9BACT|nr:penicillin acylase family protein [Persicitalea jodogahamensis]GHB58128.1 penicillin amidase [Persicitalea jodogahamensis]
MKKTLLLLFILSAAEGLFLPSFAQSSKEINAWQKQAQNITIIRDNFGVPHIYGKTDADAVFGLLYAQCEDDFPRVEMNYIEKLGRLGEVNGEQDMYNDLLIKLLITPEDAQADYKKAPAWLKKLLNAYADGINYYLHTHPETKPALLTRFEPWYPLLWTDGSIGAISTADIRSRDLEAFYGNGQPSVGYHHDESPIEKEEILTGSNGFAFSPKITESGKSILYINPHVTFYFRPEVHVVSEEGLNAYGAVTWGQFFVYQGFNEKLGWMHTSSRTDVADTYLEKVARKANGWVYTYDGKERPVREKDITLTYTKNGQLQEKKVKAFYTHHGPVMAKRNGQWESLRSNNRTMNMLIQSWQRTKARSFAEYQKAMDILENTSNNTVYADTEGNIAYWHGNFVPKRDPKYDWSQPVDGSTAATEWQGMHPVAETVHIYNPPNGWIQNCNSTPFTAAGKDSPKQADYPAYMAPDGENFRGINAVRVLEVPRKYDLDAVIAAGYDTYLTSFEILIPALVRAFEKNIPYTDDRYAYWIGPMSVLKNWDYRSGEKSVATTLAVKWGEKMSSAMYRAEVPGKPDADQVEKARYFAANGTADELLKPFTEVLDELNQKWGKWQMPWGEINRFQRASAAIDQNYRDDLPSLPVGFTSSAWGMLPSYTSRYFAGIKKRYGVNGNSFICAVEFGDRIRAKSLLAGGQSGDPASRHFFDQGEMYTQGKFKDVLFYREDVEKHAERTYKPGK